MATPFLWRTTGLNLLRLHRMNWGLTQQEFAEQAGLRPEAYAAIENGERMPTDDEALAIKRFFPNPLVELLADAPGGQ
jgi:DNA-binding XRE family transcriptional regulator